MEDEILFSTSKLAETDLYLINVLLTQAKYNKEDVLRACKFVIEKLESEKS